MAGDVVSAADVARVRAAAERLGRFLEAPGGEVQPLHGDAHPNNLIATHQGLVWIDFEEVCRGPIEWDLATMMDPDAVAAHHRPDPEVLARCNELRALQVALCLLALSDVFGDLEGWDESIRSLARHPRRRALTWDLTPPIRYPTSWAVLAERAMVGQDRHAGRASAGPGGPPLAGGAHPRLGHQYGKLRWCIERRRLVVEFWLALAYAAVVLGRLVRRV